MRQKRMVRLLSLGLMLCFALALPAYANEVQRAPLSPALKVLAEKTDVSLWHLTGDAETFSEECFLRGLNRSSLDSIRVTRLPNPIEGVLWLENRPIEAGARLSCSDLSKLTFEAASKEATRASFGFEVDDCGLEYTCTLYALDVPNASPSMVWHLWHFTAQRR